jgi:hypothetical protein
MRKRVYFYEFDQAGWPSPSGLQAYFLTLVGRERAFSTDNNDSWGLSAEGVNGTEALPLHGGRVDIHLDIIGNVKEGVLLQHRKWGGGMKHTYYSKGDLTRLRDTVTTAHGDRMPLGLYVPFETAWQAVKEFIEGDGSVPSSIEWIASEDLPKNVFPSR